ncbi:unnamed protein product [Penicillium salamii]|uniref:Zn(2)-C6 fungal-type domain-containing protein n=1 Tax=Penicillium salamii TaxID=1612424 RepID=A0A9W4IZ32_9EURO|nr:unnamed protein product [Penicillium salamii]CAG8018621.1 unnamed protein product [Penicillium salamii]CAG8126049.1 unnamed protein product [Penicillium salamii]CAG8319136.1 unnamed protein product [Penicillium salamii]CAG8351457.1 unnamed protein product [Penicillium salamii]
MPSRISRGRSRKGCLTCKIRRVKCDEEKPTCQRCHSTGRKCDYVADSPKVNTQDLQIVQHVPGIVQPTKMWKVPSSGLIPESDYRSLEFFQLHTTLCFGKDTGLHLLQAAYHEPIIRTIATAIGSLHRSFVHNENGVIARDVTQFTFQRYNKAIRQLLAIDPQTSLQSNDMFLIACILFYCFECLQGHYNLAIQHATSGLRIIKQQQLLATGRNFPRYMPRETVTLLFAILENQILEIQGESSLADELRPALFSSFSTPTFDHSHPPSNIEEMRACFELLYNKLTRFLSVCEMLEEKFEDSSYEFVARIQHLEEEHLQVRADLEAWVNTFETWLDAGGTEVIEEPHSIAILKIWKMVISVMLALEWPNTELSWDEHLDKFALIISLISDLLGAPSSPDPEDFGSISQYQTPPPTQNATALPILRPRPSKTLASTFSMSLGIVTPLYLCATRCRDSTIRHRAIDLVSTCNRREGLWDSELVGRITRRIVSIEEDAAGIQPGARYTPADIGIAARVKSLNPQYGREREITIRYNWEGNSTAPIEETFTW